MRREMEAVSILEKSAIVGPGVEFAAWAAGWLDARGTVTILKNASPLRWTLAVVFSCDEQEVVALFCENWGGHGYEAKPGRTGRRRWQWHAYGTAGASFLRAVAPYVRTDLLMRKISLALSFQGQKSRVAGVQRTPKYREVQEDYYRRMRALVQEGAGRVASQNRAGVRASHMWGE
jgi:hypothetical protein